MKKTLRVECHQIKRNNEWFDIIDELCFKSKNLYNAILYRIKEKERKGEKFSTAHSTLYKEYKHLDEFQVLGSLISNLTIKQLSKDIKSCWKSIEDWKNNPQKYKGKPNLADFKPSKDKGRTKASWQAHVKKDNSISIPCTNYQLDFIQNTDKKIKEVRFIPKPFGYIDSITHYNIEIVYEIEVPELIEEHKRIAGIDLGQDRLATVATNVEGLKPIAINGNPVKSMNQYFNKKRAKLMSYIGDRGTSKRIRKLTKKRNNKIKNYFHNASRKIVDWCVENQIDTIVIGENKFWKQESNMGKRNNQNWISIPFSMLKDQIEYKAEEYGIKVIRHEESYTSQSSFLDMDELPVYKKGKKNDYDFSGYTNFRGCRGLYKSYEHGVIHRDVNAAYNIIRKKFGDDVFDFDGECYRHPRVINL